MRLRRTQWTPRTGDGSPLRSPHRRRRGEQERPPALTHRATSYTKYFRATRRHTPPQCASLPRAFECVRAFRAIRAIRGKKAPKNKFWDPHLQLVIAIKLYEISRPTVLGW